MQLSNTAQSSDFARLRAGWDGFSGGWKSSAKEGRRNESPTATFPRAHLAQTSGTQPPDDVIAQRVWQLAWQVSLPPLPPNPETHPGLVISAKR